MKIQHTVISLLLLTVLSACMPMTYPHGKKIVPAQLSGNFFLTEDGTYLPLHQWLPGTDPRAVLIALHGFNDYSYFFQKPGEYFSKLGIACFAYDQRGFGATSKRGLWAGEATFTEDLLVITRLLKKRYPNRPIYLLGESMGGAIIISAVSRATMPQVDGIILAAPAIWARPTMPWYQSSLLWTLAHSMPWLSLTGKGLGVMASDNVEMLRALGRDPLVIKATRVESVYGLADLMDAAFDNASLLHGDILILYGEKDEIIPKEPTYFFLKKFLNINVSKKKVAFYQQGYHMLLRDLQAPIALKDIAAWINNSHDKLPSGADIRAQQLLTQYLPSSLYH
ncbi:MAG: lysophospholipase [Methylococcaceae bacterium]